MNRRELAQYDDATIARMAEGNRVGDVSRQLHPGGVLIDTLDLPQALVRTQEALNQKTIPAFEPAFVASDVLVRVDLLLPQKGSYRLVEVKSSTEVKDYHYEDASVQYWVMQHAGLVPTSVALGHINNTFEYKTEGQYQGLITEVDITASVKERLDQVPDWIAAAKATSEQTELPEVKTGRQCKQPFECGYLAYCKSLEKKTEYPVSILPRVSAKLLEQFAQKGIVDVRDIPEGYLDKESHELVRQACVTGQKYLNPDAKKALAQLPYPRYYLDFETVAPAVPRWLASRPYQQIPFQWSCHVETSPDAALEHQQFLNREASDPRRAFAESLLKALGAQGTIFVYNASFECARIEELAEHFADLAPALLALNARVFDLLPLAKKNYYHPAMMGSWSIKAVLPTLSDLDYTNLAIGNGGLAQVAYLELIDPATPVLRRDALYEDLLKYCYQDTLAMVHVAKRLCALQPN